MKLNTHSNTLQTNVRNETQNFGIGDASVVIEILRNRLYEHKIRTLCQEYICNARDAMREVGKGNSFEVTVPTSLNPVFKVRDFGPGITEDRMQNIFILYGSSTKRGDNKQTGGFGIGAKSAWAYTDSFTIVTVVDGIKRTYVAHTGVNNNGRLDLISSEETNEPNGTEIQVAVQPKDVLEFKESIFRAIFFWKEKPILKGTLDVLTLPESYKIGNLEVIQSGSLPRYINDSWNTVPLAIIDGVVYPVQDRLTDKCKIFEKLFAFVKQQLILHFETGVLEVSASRESIADSDITIKALEKAAQKSLLEVKTHSQELLSKAKTTSEYLDVYRTLYRSFHIDETLGKFNDYQVLRGEIFSDKFKNVRVTHIHNMGRYGRKVEKITKKDLGEIKIPIDKISDTYFLESWESKIIQGRRIRSLLNSKKELYLVCSNGSQNSNAWVKTISEELGLKNFQDVTYTIEPKEKSNAPKREKDEICAHVFINWLERTSASTLNINETTKTWFYLPVDDGKNNKQYYYLNAYLRETKRGEICFLSQSSIKKVEKIENFKPLKDWLDKYKPTKAEIQYIKAASKLNQSVVGLLKKIDEVKDPILKELIGMYEKTSSTDYTMPSLISTKIAELDEVKKFLLRDIEIDEAIDKNYPLLKFLANSSLEKAMLQDVAIYLNSKYKASK